MTPAEFRGWLAETEAGARLRYHVGHLGVDREEDTGLNALASAIMEAAEAGFVTLSQQRLVDGGCAYFAQRTQEISE